MPLHIFARSTFSWESSAWAGIALKCVVNSASGQQSQAELRLYFGVCVLQKFQQSSHGDGRFAFGVYSLWAGCSGFRIEAFFKLFPKLHTRGLLDMGVGVHQHICRTQIKNNVDRTNNSCKIHRIDSYKYRSYRLYALHLRKNAFLRAGRWYVTTPKYPAWELWCFWACA